MKASFAERLREAINMRGFTQTELCEMTQISQSAMSQYLSGTHEARQSKIHRMAKALNVNPAWLMGYDVPKRLPSNAIPVVHSGLESMMNSFLLIERVDLYSFFQ